MKSAVFHAAAKAEFEAAMAYYESRRPGLGVEFLETVERAIDRIQQNPNTFPVYKRTSYRHVVLQRFPYSVFFLELPNSLWIAAVAHQKRKPGYWRDRVPQQ